MIKVFLRDIEIAEKGDGLEVKTSVIYHVVDGFEDEADKIIKSNDKVSDFLRASGE